ncbi:TPA: hypothetical protein N0F65_009724 [Lagenidium giganteum]|uniref:Uncharacterized protein n=1 Tax=Lagenidium giganteum TaxID=4803 RepID=A0AAV2YH67_9STRA|nr:TPA: hypothetical protein N0F65_009724 [Lagenidium giganteum]
MLCTMWIPILAAPLYELKHDQFELGTDHPCFDHAKNAFKVLLQKLAAVPEHEGHHHPIRFVSRILMDSDYKLPRLGKGGFGRYSSCSTCVTGKIARDFHQILNVEVVIPVQVHLGRALQLGVLLSPYVLEFLMYNSQDEGFSTLFAQCLDACTSDLVSADLVSVQLTRERRIINAQDSDKWISDLKRYLDEFLLEHCNRLRNHAFFLVLDQAGCLFKVVPVKLCNEPLSLLVVVTKVLPGLTTVFVVVCSASEWLRTFKTCSNGKGRPWIRGLSPGNILPLYPFHVVSMDFVINLPSTTRGNTNLLLFQDMFML